MADNTDGGRDQSFSYSPNGNMTGGLGRSLGYDFENRPVSIAQGGVTATFAYGPEGQRFRKIRNASQTTWWLGADLEVLPDGTLIKQVVPEGRIVGALSGTGVREYLHRDSLASSKLLTNAAGTRIQRSQYLAFGDRSGSLTVDEGGGPAKPESIGYIGERGDPDTNLMYLNARWYDPVLGRFIQPDWWEVTKEGWGPTDTAMPSMILSMGAIQADTATGQIAARLSLRLEESLIPIQGCIWMIRNRE